MVTDRDSLTKQCCFYMKNTMFKIATKLVSVILASLTFCKVSSGNHVSDRISQPNCVVSSIKNVQAA